jgi:hypothetical protein
MRVVQYMNTHKRIAFLAGSLVTGTLLAGITVSAQPLNQTPTVSLPEFSRQRIQHQRIIGYSLGGYALANIALSGIAAGQTTGETKQFHRMNAYWNLVNLGIAGFGLLGGRRQNRIAEPPDTESLKDAVNRHNQMKKVLAINAGLDVLYVAGGAYLANRADNPETADRNRGFGNAILVQGGFLLAFDVVNYLIFKNRDHQRDALIQATPNGIGLVLNM